MEINIMTGVNKFKDVCMHCDWPLYTTIFLKPATPKPDGLNFHTPPMNNK